MLYRGISATRLGRGIMLMITTFSGALLLVAEWV